MDQSNAQPSAELHRLVNGYQVTQAIHVAATLGIADMLADGARTSDEIAAATACDPSALYRLLRALAAVGVFREDDERRFDLTPVGACLRSDAGESIKGWAAFVGEPYHWQAWGALLHSVRTGENAFRHVHGADVWTIRARDPEAGARFDRAMVSLARQVSSAVIAAFDFGRFRSIVDVGGGQGAFLADILVRHAHLRGILADQPHVVRGAHPLLEASGVADRCQIVEIDFFDSVPPGGDAYILKAIIHDWEDEESIAILRVCRRAMSSDAALLIVERELGPPNEHPWAKFSDLNMLVGPAGRERGEEEYAALFAAAGFRYVGATPSAIGVSVYEGVPA